MAIQRRFATQATFVFGIALACGTSLVAQQQREQSEPIENHEAQEEQQTAAERYGVLVDPVALISNPLVQKELGLDSVQTKRIDAFGVQANRQYEALLGPPALAPEVGRTRAAQIAGEAESAIHRLLNESQQERFREIMLQQLGFTALVRPDVAQALQLGQQQMTMMRQATNYTFGGKRDQYQSENVPGSNSDQRRKDRQKTKQAFGKWAAGLLTADQTARWKRLIGKPFALVPAPQAARVAKAAPATKTVQKKPPKEEPDTKHTKDSLEKVSDLLARKKAVLADVREKDEWDKGHLEAAVLVPLSELRENAGKKQYAQSLLETLPKDKIIYCHCRSGRRVLAAAEILDKLGYDVRPLGAGYFDLLGAGFQKAKR